MKEISSFVLLRVESADLISFVEKIRFSGISIYDMKIINELTAQFAVSPFEYGKIIKIAAYNDCDVKACKRVGYFWLLQYILHRKILLCGCALLIALTLYIPTRVLFVQVEGNQYLHGEQIIDAAVNAGIRFGAERREVRSEKIKNALLESMPQLQWAGITTSGCVAKIAVKERNLSDETGSAVAAENIVAGLDGIIMSCTAIKGNLVCNVGQTVTAGETLISGYLDCGGFIRKTGAEGEIYARTRRQISACSPKVWYQKTCADSEYRRYSIILGKKRINLWKGSGISDVSYDRIYKEYYAMLPGGFRLPVALAIETWLQRDAENTEFPEEEVTSWLKIYAETYLQTQMIAGTIHARQISFLPKKDAYSLSGEYSCTEMIARVQREEIGAVYE